MRTVEPTRSDTVVLAGRYRLDRILGVGGMGEVFDARHLMTGRRVALKRISAQTLSSVPGSEQRVLQEATACGSFRHPGIVEILDAGWSDHGDLFLVFEHLEGQNLECAFRQRRIAPRDLVRIAVRLLEALAAVHAAGWVHRDVKPANVILARAPEGHLQVKLIDFGIACRAEATPDDGPVVGTLEYMSPEQALGEPMDGRADLWAVGALLFRGLSGSPPWPARTPAERARSLSEPVPPSLAERRSDLPRALVGVVRRCLHLDPAQRWSNAETLASALLSVDERDLERLRPPPRPRPEELLAPTLPRTVATEAVARAVL